MRKGKTYCEKIPSRESNRRNRMGKNPILLRKMTRQKNAYITDGFEVNAADCIHQGAIHHVIASIVQASRVVGLRYGPSDMPNTKAMSSPLDRTRTKTHRVPDAPNMCPGKRVVPPK